MLKVPVDSALEWVDAGELPAHALHALYAGMTAATGAEQPLRLLWVTAADVHITVGALQNAAADLDLGACAALGVPVLRRCLGGGAVWLEPKQSCFFLIQPKGRLARGHRHLFALGTSLAVAALRNLGLADAEARSQDICVQGRKIMGTGAATLDEGCVFGTSLPPRFPVDRFLACLRAPSTGYREWLLPSLRAGVTDCARELGRIPEPEVIRAAWLEAVVQRFGSQVPQRTLMPEEREYWIQRGQDELDDLDQGETRPAVPDGIRINRLHHVFETQSRCGRLRLQVAGTEIQRIWCEEPRIDAILQQRLLGQLPERLVIRSSLGDALEAGLVDEISCRIDRLYRGIRSP